MEVMLFYNGSEKEGRERFKDFFDLHASLPQLIPVPLSLAPVERDFVELNALQVCTFRKSVPFLLIRSQNVHVSHGAGTYVKGTAHEKPDYETIKELVEYMKSKSEEMDQAIPVLLFDYLLLDKIKSIDSNCTAFRRELAPSIQIMVKWAVNNAGSDEGQKVNDENIFRARNFCQGLCEIVARHAVLTDSQRLGYSNYGM